MLGLPHTTELNKQLPKKTIYAKFGLKSAQQDKFDADVSRIVIVGEVTPTTTSIAAGVEVSGFYVVSVMLKRKDFDPNNIAMLSKIINQKMLFVLQFEEESMLAVYNTKLLCSEWVSSESAKLPLSGLNFDVVWENIIIFVGDLTIEGDNSVEEQIEQDAAKAKLLKKIEQLQAKKRKEKQFNKQIAISTEIKKLKEML